MTGFFERVSRRSAGQPGTPNGVTLSLRQRSRFEQAAPESKTVDTAQRPERTANRFEADAHPTRQFPVPDGDRHSNETPEVRQPASLELSAMGADQSVLAGHPTVSAPPAVVPGPEADASDLPGHDPLGHDARKEDVVRHDPPAGLEVLAPAAELPKSLSEHDGRVSSHSENTGEPKHVARQNAVERSNAAAMELDTGGQERPDAVEAGRSEWWHQQARSGPANDDDAIVPASLPDTEPQLVSDKRPRSPRHPSSRQSAGQVANLTGETPDPIEGLSIGQISVEFLPAPAPPRPSAPASTGRTRGFDAYARARRGILR